LSIVMNTAKRAAAQLCSSSCRPLHGALVASGRCSRRNTNWLPRSGLSMVPAQMWTSGCCSFAFCRAGHWLSSARNGAMRDLPQAAQIAWSRDHAAACDSSPRATLIAGAVLAIVASTYHANDAIPLPAPLR
jgi:hypothetical protein